MVTVRKLHPQFGAEVIGLSLQDNASSSLGAELRTLIMQYGLLVIVNTPPPKGGGFLLRLKAGLIGHTADYTTSKSSSGFGGC